MYLHQHAAKQINIPSAELAAGCCTRQHPPSHGLHKALYSHMLGTVFNHSHMLGTGNWFTHGCRPPACPAGRSLLKVTEVGNSGKFRLGNSGNTQQREAPGMRDMQGGRGVLIALPCILYCKNMAVLLCTACMAVLRDLA